jgi:hypothetical protein
MGEENNKRKRKLLSGRNKKTKKRAKSARHEDKKVQAVEQE